MKTLTNSDIRDACIELAKEICQPKDHRTIKIYGVPRGGVPVAYMLAGFLPVSYVVDTPEEADIIVDDIVDSGDTKFRYAKYNKPFYALYENQKEWLIFPYEESDIETPVSDNIVRIEQYLIGDIKDWEKEKVIVQLKSIIEKYGT